MPIQGRDIRIGAYQFEMVGNHQIDEVPLGPTGQVDFSMTDWSGGLATIQDGIFYRQQPKALSSTGADTAFPSQVLVQPQATTVAVATGTAFATAPLKQVDFSGNTYLAAGRYLYQFSGSGGWQQALDTGGAIISDLAVSQAKLIAATSSSFQYSSNGTTWTNASLAADRWGVIADKLYRAVRPNTVYATSGGPTGAWDTGSVIADSSYNINSLTGVEQFLLIGKEDGLYAIDYQGYVVPFTPELRPQANTVIADVQACVVYNGDYYARTVNGLITLSNQDGSKQRVGIDTLASPDIATPQVKALAAGDRFVYALLANSSNGLTILRRNATGAWHVYYYDPNAGPACHLAVSGVLGYPALFFSYGSAGSYTTKAIRLPLFPNPIQDSNYRYDTSRAVRLRLPRVGTAQANMTIDRLVVQADNVASGITITPYYSVDGGTITQFGSTAVSSSPATIIPTSSINGNFVDFYLDLVTNDATKTPRLLGLSWKGAYQSPRRRNHTYYINLSKDHQTRRGGRTLRGTAAIISDLNTLRTTQNYVTCYDEYGASFSAMVQEVSIIKPLALDPAVVRSNPEENQTVARVILMEKPDS